MTITSIDPVGSANPFGDVNSIIFATVRTSGAGLGTKPEAALTAYYPSPVDRVINSAEALYACVKVASAGAPRDALSVACAQLADFAVANQWHELGQTDRGLKMSGACRRLVGLGSQAEADDPAVRPDLVD